MEVIRKWRDGYALLFIVSICFTMLLYVKYMMEALFILGFLNVILLIILVKQNSMLYDAELIRENSVLAVSSAFITLPDGQKKSADATIVSTFGILIGGKIYKWGCGGVHGVQLKAVMMDRAWIYLTFGDETGTIRVELLHGLTKMEEVADIKQKLWRETGITAMIHGW
ncbi:hypothetical protein [Desulfoscipio sp. XC116]|uniref:hypothetical protein n=1 Tax=Desulfoscipio sp. XC116 TaxID=3144975 RepID=UPI00325A8919